MRFGIIQYDNGEIVSLSNLDKKLPKEKRQYIILEETENASELDRLLAKYTGKVMKPKIKKDPPVCSIQYCIDNNFTFLGMLKNKMKYLWVLAPGEKLPNTQDKIDLITQNHEEYVYWYNKR